MGSSLCCSSSSQILGPKYDVSITDQKTPQKYGNKPTNNGSEKTISPKNSIINSKRENESTPLKGEKLVDEDQNLTAGKENSNIEAENNSMQQQGANESIVLQMDIKPQIELEKEERNPIQEELKIETIGSLCELLQKGNSNIKERFLIRGQIFDKIASNYQYYLDQWNIYKNEGSTHDYFKKILVNMFAQANTIKRIERFQTLELGVKELGKSNTYKKTNLSIIKGNIFNNKKIWKSKAAAIVISGSNLPKKIYKSGTDCLEGDLLIMTDFLKAMEPEGNYEYTKCYYYEDVTVLKKEKDEREFEILEEGNTGRVNILYSVTSILKENESFIASDGNKELEDIKLMLEEILRTAQAFNVKDLYLPSIGCGKKNLDPLEVAKVYREIFKNFDGWVENVFIYNKDTQMLDLFMQTTGYTINNIRGSINNGSTYLSIYNMETVEAIPLYDSLMLNVSQE